MKRLGVCLILALGLPAAAVMAAAEPAAACSCVGLSDADALARADAVFVGKVTDYDSAGLPGSSSDRAVWTFKVRGVYKGEVTRTQEVVSYSSGASCGLEIPKTGVALVFATTSRTLPNGPAPTEGQLYATLCGGTRALSEGDLQPGLAKRHPPSSVDSKRKPASRRGATVDLLTQADGANGELARGGGVLRFDGARECVYLASGGKRWLPQWPEGYYARADPLRIYDASDTLIAKEGDRVTFSGGFHDPAGLEPGTETCGVDADDGLFVMGHPA